MTLEKKTKRVLRCIALIDLVFFLYMGYVIVRYYDVFFFMKTSLHRMTELDYSLYEELGLNFDKIPYYPMAFIAGTAKAASIGGCAYILFGNDRRPVFPLRWGETILLLAGTLLLVLAVEAVIRGQFADTYCRGWMQLADDALLPLQFLFLLVYGLCRFRGEKSSK